MAAARLAPAGRVEEIAHRQRPADALEGSACAPTDAREPALALMRRARSTSVPAGSRSPARSGHSTRAAPLRQRFVEAEFVQLGWRRQAVEVEMLHRHARVVGLHQREGRARHFEGRVVGQRPDQRPGQRRLAGAEIALQRQHVAGAQRHGEILAEPCGRGLVGEETLQPAMKRATPPRRGCPKARRGKCR